jgi:hypothetical protein
MREDQGKMIPNPRSFVDRRRGTKSTPAVDGSKLPNIGALFVCPQSLVRLSWTVHLDDGRPNEGEIEPIETKTNPLAPP